jgi:hypothetical protein
MAYIEGEGRKQGTLFPVILDDLISSDHICRVTDAFVEKLAMSELGFERAQAAYRQTTDPTSLQFPVRRPAAHPAARRARSVLEYGLVMVATQMSSYSKRCT